MASPELLVQPEPLVQIDRIAQQRPLAMLPNPGPSHDYVVTLAGALGEVHVELRYVPDRWVLAPNAFADYLSAFDKSAETPEEIGVAILADLNNEVVPRWLQVTVTKGKESSAYTVVLEDRQPDWDNPILWLRLNRY